MHRMSPIELFHEARLTTPWPPQAAIIRDRPDDIAERLFLCDLLAFNGDRRGRPAPPGRALLGPAEIQPYVAEWRDLLTADDARHAGSSPEFVIDPPPHVLRRLEAIEGLRAGRTDGIQT